MKTIICKFKSEGKDVQMTVILNDELTELSKSKKNQATDIITDFMEEDGEWSVFCDREETEKIELGYELVFKVEEFQQTLKPVKAITWVGGIITDSQKMRVTIK